MSVRLAALVAWFNWTLGFFELLKKLVCMLSAVRSRISIGSIEVEMLQIKGIVSFFSTRDISPLADTVGAEHGDMVCTGS